MLDKNDLKARRLKRIKNRRKDRKKRKDKPEVLEPEFNPREYYGNEVPKKERF